MRKSGVDGSTYVRSFALLARFPQVMVGPLVAGVLQYAVFSSLGSASGPTGFDSLSAGLYSFLGLLITGMGFALAIVVADEAWRYDRAPLSRAWNDLTRKIGGIFFAVLGVQFVVYVAGLVGAILGSFGAIVLQLLANFFLVYTIAAAAIGGLPGGSPALEASISRARGAPLPTAFVAALTVLVTDVLPSQIVTQFLPLIFASPIFQNGLVDGLLLAAIRSVLTGYLALVLAKTYADVSFGRRW